MAITDSVSSSLHNRHGIHEDLLGAIERIDTPGGFVAFGSLFPAELIDVGLSIEGLGPISLPLASADARSLVALSKKIHAERACPQYHIPSMRSFWGINACHVGRGKEFEGLLKEAVSEAQVGLKLAADIEITPHLYKLVVQKWDSSIRSPLYRLEQHHLQIATLVVFLPSRHEGGQVSLNHNESTAEVSTASDSHTEYQYLAFNCDTIVNVEAITSGTHLALIYWLVAHNTVAPINNLGHSESPGAQELERVLSTWSPHADSGALPSYLVYTLKERYILDLLQHPRFKEKDAAQVQALKAAAKKLDVNVYFTVLARSILATYDVSGEEQPEYGGSWVKQRNLETLIPLCRDKLGHGTWECISIQGWYVTDGLLPHSLQVEATEMLQADRYDTFGSEEFYDICYGARRGREMFDHVFYTPALLLVPEKSGIELDIRIWIRSLRTGRSEDPMRGWLHDMMQNGKKEGVWDENHMQEVCRIFLKVANTAFEEESIRSFANPRSWSSALDLITRLAQELGSLEKVQKALSMRKMMDSSHAVPVLEQFRSSEYLTSLVFELENPGSVHTWHTLNWWISLGRSLKDRMAICDHVMEQLKRQCGISEKKTTSEQPRRELTSFGLQASKKARTRDALLEITRPRPGDGVILARLKLTFKDDLLHQCAMNFLADELKTARFILADITHFQKALGRGEISDELRDRYVTDILAPAIHTFKVTRMSSPPKVIAASILGTIARLGHELGGDFPKLLLPLTHQLALSITLVLTFLDESMTSRHWTQQDTLNRLGITVVLPTIEKLQLNDGPAMNKLPNEISTMELKRLMKHICRSGNREPPDGLRDLFSKLFGAMVNMETLDPRDLQGVLPYRRCLLLQISHREKWGHTHTYERR